MILPSSEPDNRSCRNNSPAMINYDDDDDDDDNDDDDNYDDDNDDDDDHDVSN